MSNNQLVRQIIHDPSPVDSMVVKEDYAIMSMDEYPIAEVILPDNVDISIQDGVLKLSVKDGDSVTTSDYCLFDKPFFDTVRYIDSFGVSVKLMSARNALYPQIFISDFQQSIFKQVHVESQPFNLQEVVAENCFYAKNLITDISRKVILAQEQFGDTTLDCKYIKSIGDDVFTDTNYSDGIIQMLIHVRVKRFYICIKQTKYLPLHKVQETCFNESSSVRKVAIAYNAKVRNANK